MASVILANALNQLYIFMGFGFAFLFLHCRDKFKPYRWLFAAAVYALCIVISMPPNPLAPMLSLEAWMPVRTFLFLILPFAVMLMLFKDRLLNVLFIYACSKIIELVAGMGFSIITMAFMPEFAANGLDMAGMSPLEVLLYFLPINFFTLLIYVVVTVVVLAFQHTKYRASTSLLLALVPVSQVALFVFYLAENGGLQISQLMGLAYLLPALIFALIGLIGDIALFKVVASIQRQTELENRARFAEMQQQYYALLEAQQQQVREMQHDMKNQITALKGAASAHTPEYDEYLKQLEARQPLLQLYYCPIPAINALLVNKAAVCRSAQIDFNFKVEAADLSSAQTFDLVTIISNLLDNAIEAAQSASGGSASGKSARGEGVSGGSASGKSASGAQKEFVKLKIKQTANALSIKCENSCAKSEKGDFGADKKYLDKTKATHGNGLKIIESTVQKYSGDCEVECAGGVYSFTAVLYFAAPAVQQ